METKTGLGGRVINQAAGQGSASEGQPPGPGTQPDASLGRSNGRHSLAEEMWSRSHKPRIAYAFFRAGMIEAWGRGIRRIVDICREAGKPAPTWRLDAGGDGLWVRFPFSETYQVTDAAVRGNAPGIAPTNTAQKHSVTTQNTTQKSSLTTRKPA